MVHSKFGSALVLCLPLVLAACSKDRPAQSASGYEQEMTPASRSAPSAPGELGSEPSERLYDAQVMTVLRAINVAEVDQAKVAVDKAKDESVKRFAETMIAHHSQAVKDIDDLDGRLALEPTESQLVTELRMKARNVENKLSEADDPSFDKQYMLAQVDMHRTALDTIDSRLTPAATRDEVKQIIAAMRPRVADHLQMAQTIVSSLK